MAGEDQDKFEVDPMNDNGIKYDDIPEAHRQDFVAQFK